MAATVETYYSRKFSKFSGGYGAIGFNRHASWGRIRVGMLATLVNSASSTHTFQFGFCNGSTNIPGTGSVDHFLGMHSTGAWTWGGTNYTTGTIFCGYQFGGGSVSNSGGAAGFDISDIASFDHVSPWFVDIIKGTPYEIRCVGYDTVPSGANSYPPATFHSNMGYNGNLDAAKVPGGYVISSTAFTVDEGTYGDFDHVCVYWQGSANNLLIDEIAFSQFLS